MNRPALPLVPLAAAALVVAGVVAAGLHLAGGFVGQKALQKGIDRLARTAPGVQAALARRDQALRRSLGLTAKQPTLRAAAATRDPLTVVDNLAELAERLEGSHLLWFDGGGDGGARRLVGVLERTRTPPRAHVLQAPVPDPRADLLRFDQAPAPPVAPLPAALSSTGWAVVGLDPTAFVELAEAGAPSPAASGPAPLIGLDGGLARAACVEVAYEDGSPLGALAAVAPLDDDLARDLGRESGARLTLAGAGAAAPPVALGRSYPDLEGGLAAADWSAALVAHVLPSRDTAARAGSPVTTCFDHLGRRVATLAIPLGTSAGGVQALAILDQDLDSAWASLSLRDLETPLFGGAVAAVVLGLLAVPFGMFLWISRPPLPAPVTVVRPGAEDGPAPAGVAFARSAVAQVLDLFPEERYGPPQALGRGGMGMVIRLFDSRLGRPLALKVMTLADSDEDLMSDLKVRFLREARTMAGLAHPGLPAIHQVSEAPAPHFLMEFIEGQSLKERFEQEGPQDPDQVADWLRQAAEALAHAHDKGVVHRDIKPDNIMLEPGGGVRVIDFGIALTEETTRVTREGYFVGTMGFISPEQLAHAAVDERADVYSLAATGYFLLGGGYPYTTPQLAVGQGFDPAPLPETVGPVLATALSRALRLDRARRPATMHQLVRLLRGEELPEPEPEPDPVAEA